MKLLIFAKRHLPTIITVGSCLGVAATGYLSAKGAVKAQKKLETEEFKRNFDAGEEEHEDIPTIDKVKLVYKDYMPAVIAGGITIGSIIFANAYHIKTEKNLLAAAMMSQTLLERYERQVLERTDPEMAAEIRKDVIGEALSCELDDIHESYSDPSARMRIKDPYSGTIYYASQTELLLGEVELNKCLMNGGGMSLKDWISQFKHEPIKTNLIEPETIGWYMDDSYSWDSSYFGFHCAPFPYWDKCGDYCIAFTHDPMTPSEELY